MNLQESLTLVKEKAEEQIKNASRKISDMGQQVLEKTSELGH